MFDGMNGWKTYLTAAAGVIVAGLAAKGYLDPEQAKQAEAIIGFFVAICLRHGVASAGPKKE